MGKGLVLLILILLGLFLISLFQIIRGLWKKPKTDYSAKRIISWLYSEKQGTWVSPPSENDIPLSDKKGNIYTGNEEFVPWENGKILEN